MKVEIFIWNRDFCLTYRSYVDSCDNCGWEKTIVVGKRYRIVMFNDVGENCFSFINLNLENFPK